MISANKNPKEGIYGRTWDGAEDELEEGMFTNVYDDMQSTISTPASMDASRHT